MSNYDASIRVSTKLDNSDLKQLQKDFDKLEAKLDSLYAKGEKLEALGVNKQSKQWQALRYDVAQTEVALADVKDRIQEVNAINTTKQASAFDRIRNASRKCFMSMHDGTKKTNGLFATMWSRLKGIALSLLVFNWITKGFNAMVSAIKEGFENLAQYSDDYNKCISDLKSQTAQLKNGLATAFEPIANIAIPYLTRLVEWLNVAVDKIAQLFAALQGKSTYTRAKKQVIDYAKSLDTASKSAKRALASFDELNVINKNESADSSAQGLTGADAFEEAKINPEIYEMLEKVKNILQIIKPLAIAIGIIFLGWKLAHFLKDLGSVTTSLKNAYGIIMIIAGTVVAVYEYLKMWEDGVDWEGVIGYILGVSIAVGGLALLFGPVVAGIALIVAGIAGLVLAFKDMTENGITAENSFLAIASAVGIVAGVFIAFGATAGVVVAAVMAVVGAIAAVVVWAGNGEEALDTLKRELKNIGEFVNAVFVGDWEKAFEAIVKQARDATNLGNIIVESFINCIIKGINWLIEKLNSIAFDVPDWVPVIGGESWSPNISPVSEVSLPRLAEGDVIPGGRPFAAILGDQPAGQTNIETPLPTMIKAFKEAIHDMGGTGGDITFIAQLDGNVLFRETVKQNQLYKKATGRSAY